MRFGVRHSIQLRATNAAPWSAAERFRRSNCGTDCSIRRLCTQVVDAQSCLIWVVSRLSNELGLTDKYSDLLYLSSLYWQKLSSCASPRSRDFLLLLPPKNIEPFGCKFRKKNRFHRIRDPVARESES